MSDEAITRALDTLGKEQREVIEGEIESLARRAKSLRRPAGVVLDRSELGLKAEIRVRSDGTPTILVIEEVPRRSRIVRRLVSPANLRPGQRVRVGRKRIEVVESVEAVPGEHVMIRFTNGETMQRPRIIPVAVMGEIAHD